MEKLFYILGLLAIASIITFCIKRVKLESKINDIDAIGYLVLGFAALTIGLFLLSLLLQRLDLFY